MNQREDRTVGVTEKAEYLGKIWREDNKLKKNTGKERTGNVGHHEKTHGP